MPERVSCTLWVWEPLTSATSAEMGFDLCMRSEHFGLPESPARFATSRLITGGLLLVTNGSENELRSAAGVLAGNNKMVVEGDILTFGSGEVLGLRMHAQC